MLDAPGNGFVIMLLTLTVTGLLISLNLLAGAVVFAGAAKLASV